MGRIITIANQKGGVGKLQQQSIYQLVWQRQDSM